MTRKSPFHGALAGCGLAVCLLASACEHATLVIKKPCLIRLRDGVAQLSVQLLAASEEAQEAKSLEAIVERGRLSCRSAACAKEESGRRICLALPRPKTQAAPLPGTEPPAGARTEPPAGARTEPKSPPTIEIPLIYEPRMSGADSLQVSLFAVPCSEGSPGQQLTPLAATARTFRIR